MPTLPTDVFIRIQKTTADTAAYIGSVMNNIFREMYAIPYQFSYAHLEVALKFQTIT